MDCFFSNLKKFTSPANEFLLHKCRNKRKMKKWFFFSNPKKITSPSNEFLLHRIEWKNAQVLLMSFSYKGIAKKCTSPSNEFLLYRTEWKNAQVLLMSFSYMHADRWTDEQTNKRTYIHPPPYKRYSPIISSTCGPNNMY